MLPSDRIALFIDGANFHATCKALGFDVDYKRLLTEFQSRGVLLRAYYFRTIVEDREYSSVRPFIDWLGFNGYTVVTKEPFDVSGRRKIKGSMNVELAVHAIEIADRIDRMFLFSGNGDFSPLLKGLQRRGVLVTVVSSMVSQPAMVADELRRQADAFVDLAELKPRVGRLPSERIAPRKLQTPFTTARCEQPMAIAPRDSVKTPLG
jgi:uncharacterized LabA/DUF88 family protein